MSPLFTALDFFAEAEPHAAPLNMAIDEALLRQIERPLLRVYRWATAAVSFGYFDQWKPVRVAYPQRELVRRWTGGGVVPHGEDFTYSLIVPMADPFARSDTAESYRAIHELIAEVLRDLGSAVSVTPASEEKISPACFENPVRSDIVWNQRKIAGAAQRRSRLGLLHQGSIQGIRLPPELAARLAERFSREIRACSFDVREAAQTIAAEKYATAAWTERI